MWKKQVKEIKLKKKVVVVVVVSTVPKPICLTFQSHNPVTFIEFFPDKVQFYLRFH